MAVTTVSIARVSQNLRAFNLLEALRANQVGLFRVQTQVATGLRFLQPSDDPPRAATALGFDRRLERLSQLQNNLREVNAVLSEGEAAAADAADLMIEARQLALETAGDTSSADERKALAVVVDSVLERMIAVGNRQYLDSYIFSGQRTPTPPFVFDGGGVRYQGDAGRRETIVDTDLSQEEYTVSGAELFGAVSAGVMGNVDLNPILTPDTRVSDLRGVSGKGVRLGRIEVDDGSTRVQIDLSDAATVGDLVDRLNDSLPAGLAASLGTYGVNIVFSGPGSDAITISDVGGGQTARDLGIDGTFARFTSRAEPDLDPKVTLTTPLIALRGGAGLNTGERFTIRNGSEAATIDLSEATSVEDLLNSINQAGVSAWARIAADGQTIEVRNRISGTSLAIEEDDGTLATQLGIRSMRGDTKLSDLNDGQGVHTVDGNDVRITTSDGATIDVDIDGAITLQDVLDRLNAAGGGSITAALAARGNGIVITDNTTGGLTLSLSRLNQSPAIDGLGLNVPATGNQILGRDVNEVRVDGVFTALVELRDALRADDRAAIQLAAQRVERTMAGMQEVQGRLASQARGLSDRADRVAGETTSVQVMQSGVRDMDIAEAAVRLQQLQTALQANLAMGSRIMNLSLIDFLR
jgi:flagellin-like hook-associated protein FlgL